MFFISGLVAQNFPEWQIYTKIARLEVLTTRVVLGFLRLFDKLYIEIFQMPIEVWKQTPVSGFLNILLILHLFSVGFWNIRPFLC